jgi:hypothetical protein
MLEYIKTIPFRNVAAIVSIISAAIVMASGHDGWGWLIFIAIMCIF